MNINYMKAGIAALTLVCMTLLIAVGTVTFAAGGPIITMIVGYCVGNSIAMKQDVPVQPIISRKQDQTYEVTAPANVHVSAPTDIDRADFEAWKKLRRGVK